MDTSRGQLASACSRGQARRCEAALAGPIGAPRGGSASPREVLSTDAADEPPLASGDDSTPAGNTGTRGPPPPTGLPRAAADDGGGRRRSPSTATVGQPSPAGAANASRGGDGCL